MNRVRAVRFLVPALGLTVALSPAPARAGAPPGVPCSARAKAVVADTTRIFSDSGSRVDSYESSLGPYGGSNVGDQGDVQSGTTIAANGGVIHGAEIQNTPAGLGVIPAPAGAKNLPLGSAAPGSVNINTAAQSITLAPGNYVVANLNVNAPGAITVSPPGQVLIWVTGSLNLGGSENLGGIPDNLQFLVTSNTPVNLNSGGKLFGFVYAPAAAVNVNSPVFGSVVGSSVALNSGGAVHFDGSSVCPFSTAPVIGAGFSSTCAVNSGGDAKCWGANDSGQLGDGSTMASLVPVPVTGLTGNTIDITGPDFSSGCAVTAAGGVVCWGSNESGQLGNGTTTPSTTPVPVTGLSSGVTAVSVGTDAEGSRGFACAITAGGGVVCWGSNTTGNLGDGTTTGRLTPVPVVGLTSGVTAISAGVTLTCAVAAGGAAMCWGSNGVGELGNNNEPTNSSVPVQVTGLTTGVTSISAGFDVTCAVTAGGGVSCWGDNGRGALGNPSVRNSPVPVPVIGLTSGATAVAVGRGIVSFTSCALLTGGSVSCWGSSNRGALGAGPGVLTSPVPLAVPGITGAVSLSNGGEHTCVILASGGAACWGANDSGQLGDGTTTNRFSPVAVLDFP
jgi:alpha-tubulin suppressor-like RCC1 family protein